jgi:hypothetical protein
MNNRILPLVESEIRKYREDHRGESPLYIVLNDEEADHLIDEVKKDQGFEQDMLLTEYNGTRIVKHMSIPPGEIRLTNDLPETGS